MWFEIIKFEEIRKIVNHPDQKKNYWTYNDKNNCVFVIVSKSGSNSPNFHIFIIVL